ncbi:hypothetical protein [Knoellia subterranea]|uniref:Glycosyltransferase RgtA/B/C/D-like domain-containing protein n=1 Tax=Knoellia subterranea KCTC 19937 TaxID=1385521 RepID=A0A0A0JNZ4_9MICO|nr:hypothetical protein [Knoellia subterranea]KGN39130.1 hypothetical protein N803_01055 [Knoellia subterranea KCTC 19937]
MSALPRHVVTGALALIVGLVVAAIFRVAVGTNSYNFWGAVIVIPIAVAINVALVRKVSRKSADAWLPSILGTALALKIVGALARYYVAYVLYAGQADAQRYNLYAAAHYPLWRNGIFRFEQGGKQGTEYMEAITTALYTVIGPSPLAAFVIFALFAFWGQYLLYRAFCIALPEGNRKRYAVLVLMLPSLLYWPSSIGKESWLMFFMGVTALGVAKFFSRSGGAFLLLFVGAAGTALLRPHLSVLLFAALFVAQLFRPARVKGAGLVSKVAGVLVLGASALLLTSQSASFLGIDDLSVQAVSDTIDEASQQASKGGAGTSAFDSRPISSPVDLPRAIVTVLFRPFPFEAHNAQMLVQSLEGLLLIYLLVKAWPQLRMLPSILKRNPYVTFCVVYTMAFIWAFSGFGNFGLLARQRVLMIPFFLVLLALPSVDTLKQQFAYRPRERVRVHR